MVNFYNLSMKQLVNPQFLFVMDLKANFNNPVVS